MIKLIPKDDIISSDSVVWKLEADRPGQKRDIRKLAFFILREGVYQTVLKVLASLNKESRIDSKVIAARSGRINAISFDGGENFYSSSMETEGWAAPFSYDTLAASDSPHVIKALPSTRRSLYCVGYGNYVQTYTRYLHKRFHPRMFVDYNPKVVSGFASKFDFSSHDFSVLSHCWAQDTSPVAVIASYHSDHAKQAYELCKINPDGFVFVEKPPLVDYHDIQLYREMYAASANVQIGFNRRFSPLVNKIKSALVATQPLIITISVNEVKISNTHWYLWPNQGTRITGNACHWIDLCQYFVGDLPHKIQLTRSTLSPDDCVLLVTYQNGSLAVITLTDKGNDLRGVQETIEVKQANVTFRLDDMMRLTVDSPGKGRITTGRWARDKGHKRMYQAFQQGVLQGKIINQYPLADLEVVSKVTFEFSNMLTSDISEKILTWDANK